MPDASRPSLDVNHSSTITFYNARVVWWESAAAASTLRRPLSTIRKSVKLGLTKS
jgi:hypothetical protein